MRPGFAFSIAGVTAYVVRITRKRIADGEIRFREPDLEHFGSIPIPPYLRGMPDQQDEIRYQTVFAESPGSVAAPTAGLHFTPELLSRIAHAYITLHVGMGTFLPVKAERVHRPPHALRALYHRRADGAGN